MSIRRVINWDYERASWQWDVLCLVCLFFIFLTPKAWFVGIQNAATKTAESAVQIADDCGCDNANSNKTAK